VVCTLRRTSKPFFVASGITAQEFTNHHHQRKSLKTHLNYCRSRSTYLAGGNNELLHAKFAAMAEARADHTTNPSRDNSAVD
jgi:hypothetical protein